MGDLLTTDLAMSWETDGWCVLEGVVPEVRLQKARSALARLFPSAQEFAEGGVGERDDRWRTWDAPWPEFPFPSRTLNGLVLSEGMIDWAEELLGGCDVRMYLAIATAKYAGQPSDFNQLLHVDYPNHTLTVPRPGGSEQVEAFVYLTDVGPENGATRFVPRALTAHIPVEEHTLNYEDHGELYEEATEVSAPAGSVVLYRPDVYHCSVDFSDPTQARFMLHVSYKLADMEWGGYQAWPIKGYSPEWHDFVQNATPKQLRAVGFPPPGHAFWTHETVRGVSRRYPGLDMGPWLGALGELSQD
ncbi:MAG TPA: phytanoyl-CoA dioxygenase family protein [Acidimicrobiales bacterium]|nr:phytanoyl-CoA dioxygenase family protein [Acidimicrobiales bacterium]